MPPRQRTRRGAAALGLAVLASGCQTLGTFPEPATVLSGTWDNAAQFAAADPALHRPPAAGAPYEWLDRQHAVFRIVEAPALAGTGGTVVHLVWRSGGPDGPVSRQRLWVFRPDPRTGRLAMHFHAFLDPAPFATAAPDSFAFRTLTLRDVTSYPGACALPVRRTRTGFVARIPEGCTITAQSGRTMTLAAEIRLSGNLLSYAEAGILPDGQFAFRVPNPGPYLFNRQ